LGTAYRAQMPTTFKLENMDSARAVVSFATVGEPRRRYTVDFSNPGSPGAILATDNNGNRVTLGSFRIDADTPHPGYMKLRNLVAAIHLSETRHSTA
jgi:hypothetical protein